ncbi:hypothetical protein PPACK8108_LOCUS18300, partial [Phakopsora pachyrhizi]
MKLLAFVGDFFTPMLSFLLFFYSHSTILCSTALLFFLIILYLLLFCPFIFVLSLSCLNPLNPLGGLYYTCVY